METKKGERETTQILKHKWMTPHESYIHVIYHVIYHLCIRNAGTFICFSSRKIGISIATVSLFQYFSMATLCKRKLKLPSLRKGTLWYGPITPNFQVSSQIGATWGEPISKHHALLSPCLDSIAAAKHVLSPPAISPARPRPAI